MDPRHRKLAEIALQATGSNYGLALAGGYAVRAHGMGGRRRSPHRPQPVTAMPRSCVWLKKIDMS